MEGKIVKDAQYFRFCLYGFFKNLRFFEAFLVLFFLNKGLSFLEIGLLYTIREIIRALMEIPSGLIADALGRKKILISSFLIYILSFIGFSFSQNFYAAATSMAVFALADSFRTGVHKAMIFHYLKTNGQENLKIDYYGHTRSWSQAGSAISAAMGALIVFISAGYNYIFMLAAIPYFIDAIVVWSYPNYLNGKIIPLKWQSIKLAFKEIFIASKQSLSSSHMLRSLLSLSLYTAYYKSVKDYVQPLIKSMALALPILMFLEDKQKTAVLIGLFYFITYWLTAFASRRSAKFVTRFTSSANAMNITLSVGLISGILVGVFFKSGILIASVILFIVIMMLENIRKPIGVAMVAESGKDESMASVLSVQSQAASIIAALIAPLLGYFADLYSPGISLLIVSSFIFVIYRVSRLKA